MLLTLLLLVLVGQVILRRMSQEFREEILLHLVILPTEALEAVGVIETEETVDQAEEQV